MDLLILYNEQLIPERTFF
uniref:Uncharacterized protein n=1 Tax=Oryza punctata TaxID=4537 RepID=A0A0E0JQD0_ORYPU